MVIHIIVYVLLIENKIFILLGKFCSYLSLNDRRKWRCIMNPLKRVLYRFNSIIVELVDECDGNTTRLEIDTTVTSTTFTAEEIAELFCLKKAAMTKNIFKLKNGSKLRIENTGECVYVTVEDPVFGTFCNISYDITDETKKIFNECMPR